MIVSERSPPTFPRPARAGSSAARLAALSTPTSRKLRGSSLLDVSVSTDPSCTRGRRLYFEYT